MGVVVYLRTSDEHGNVHCSFVMGKSRVAPLKAMTIPRMELAAATLAVKLSRLVDEQLDFPIEKIHFWTDSTTVLRYIANTKTRFQTFVANRLAIINAHTTFDQWHYVNTKENPADCASRGVSVIGEFIDHHLWFHGPEFIWKPESTWLSNCDIDTAIGVNDVEVKKCVNTTLIQSSFNGVEKILQHFSDWKRLKVTVGWFLKAKDNLRKIVKQKIENREKLIDSGVPRERIMQIEKAESERRVKESKKAKEIPFLSSDILDRAEREIVAYEQRQYYADELKILAAKHGYVKRSSQLSRLDPILHEGVIKVGGRLEKLNAPFTAKHQIIIPKNSTLAKMIAIDAHRSAGHMGKNSTLAVIREKFWIPGISSVLKSLISKCVICRRYQSPPLHQKMANLPSERLELDDPPFTRVGMDYFGPFELKSGRSTVKRYGVIFTCLNTRAVHLEVSFSLDTDSCIDAVRRFIARRGKPKFIRSDNGTNLVGAEKELREAIKTWNVNQIHSHLSQSGIEWTFNPPSASHFGGVWERLIRSVRKVLYSVLHEQTIHLNDEGLATLLCEVESILNGRPLTPTSDDPNDLSALTPNHLLLLRSGETCPPGTFSQTDNYVRRRWRQIQYLADIFWKRWTKEYLPLLQSRQTWLKEKRNVKEGDLVLLVENGPRNYWNLGRVLEVQKDKHDIVRVVKVKTVSNILTRPITKLCLVLESDNRD
jgi:transposase InsO family protein